MVLIDVWPSLINIVGIDTTNFILMLTNLRNGMLTRGRRDLVDYYTREEIEVEFILDYFLLKVGIRGPWKLVIS